MQSMTKRFVLPVVGTVLVLAGLVVGSTTGWLSQPAVQAQETTAAAGETGAITVVGEGEVSIQPDVAHVNIGVETLRDTVQEASSENRTTVEDVLNVLMEQGIAEEDIQTSNYNVSVERYGPEGPLAESDVSYRVSNNVSVNIRDLEAIGEILDATVEAGANSIYGIEFDLEDATSAESEARAAAVENARTKAEDIAELSGVELGNIIAVSEIIGGGGAPFMAEGRGGGASSPIAPGELDVVIQLQIDFAIAD